MKSKWVIVVHILLALGLAWGLGYTQAAGKSASQTVAGTINPADTDNPSEPASPQVTVRKAFNYQGVLKESGALVTGTRNMAFGAFHTAGCSGTAGETYGPVPVSVNKGQFSVDIGDFVSSEFVGYGIWLGITIEGTLVGCQEVLPVPYALSLIPGASIHGDETYGILSGYNYADGVNAVGLYGTTSGTGGAAGVRGDADENTSYGIQGINTSSGGIAMYSDGAFYSTEDSVLQLSPHALISRGGTGLTLTPQATGGMKIDASVAGTAYYITLPISTLGTLFGSKFYVSAFKVCHHVVAGSKITATQALKGNGAGSYVFYINNVADRQTTTIDCYSIPASLPRVVIDNASWFQFTLQMAAGGTVYIDSVELTLSQSAN